jgi:hypothetical protein
VARLFPVLVSVAMIFASNGFAETSSLKLKVKGPTDSSFVPLEVSLSPDDGFGQGKLEFSPEKNEKFLAWIRQWSPKAKLVKSGEYLTEKPDHVAGTIYVTSLLFTNGETTQEKVRHRSIGFIWNTLSADDLKTGRFATEVPLLFLDIHSQEYTPNLAEPGTLIESQNAVFLQVDSANSSAVHDGETHSLASVRRGFQSEENLEFLAADTRSWFAKKYPQTAVQLNSCSIVEENYHTFKGVCAGVPKSAYRGTFKCQYSYRLASGTYFIESRKCSDDMKLKE